jgi:electron transport complex protein RnfE
VTNCAILGRAEAFASKNTIRYAVTDGFSMGLGFTLVLVVIGAFREIIGHGTLFANATLLLGQGFSFIEMTIIPDYRGFLIMALPPGGFIALGILLAIKQNQEIRKKAHASADKQEPILVNMESSLT